MILLFSVLCSLFSFMSHIGKQLIKIPEGVEVKINDSVITIKGPKGELNQKIIPGFKIELKDGKISVVPIKKSKNTRSLWGLMRSLISNMTKGTVDGFEKKLEIEGVGYRASVSGDKLILNLGFSHPIEIEAPKGIEFRVDKNIITVSGIDKQLVGQIAADIRAKRKPEPYKGKGIRYFGEVIKRKAGKKAVAAG